jgi:ABC-type glutathione transport system ATPase component
MMNQDVHDGRWHSALGTPKTVRSRAVVPSVIAGLAVVAGAALAGATTAAAARSPWVREPRRRSPMTTQPVQAIQVQGLEKSYKKLRVLRGVDFDVARGSIFALLGSNGAGKTTVVRIMSTLLKPDAGTATVDGFDVARQAAGVRETISLTGQHP